MTDNRSAYNAAIYDGHIINVLPYYHEFHKQIIDLVRATGHKERSTGSTPAAEQDR